MNGSHPKNGSDGSGSKVGAAFRDNMGTFKLEPEDIDKSDIIPRIYIDEFKPDEEGKVYKG
jgi:hypothetical protein